MRKRWWLATLAVAGCVPTSAAGVISFPLSVGTYPTGAIAQQRKKHPTGDSSFTPASEVVAAASAEVLKSSDGDNEAPSVADRTIWQDNGETSKHTNCKTPERNDSVREGTSGDGSREEILLEIGWWDIFMLLLLALLALSGSAALIASSFIGDLWRRFCQAYGPLRRFMKLRTRSQVKLQILVSEYERVSQERSRIAPLWFVARQTRDKRELAALKKQAYDAEEILANIRRQYANELAEAGFLRLVRRFISSRAWAEDGTISSGSSDSSVLSASTVESLVHKRIQAEEVDLSSPHDQSDQNPGAEDQEPHGSVEGRRNSSGWTSEAQEPGLRSQSSNSSRRSPSRCGGDVEGDSDDALPPQMPRGIRDDTKLLSYKLDQLTRRKVGAMRRIVQQSAKHNTFKDMASSKEASDTRFHEGRTEGDKL